VGAGGIVTVIVTTVPDAVQYNIYGSVSGARTLQGTILQPAPVVQPDGQSRIPATASVTLTAIIGTGRAENTTNSTGWNHAALVTAGQAKADGTDVRVLIGGVPAPFQLVAPNTANTRVWVLLAMGVGGQQTIHLQWGNRNPATSTVSTAQAPATGPVTPPAEVTPSWQLQDQPIIDLTNSNNYQWTWNGSFYDYVNITRPGSWQSVSSVGVGYGFKQDNNIVRRGVLTAYSTPSSLTNGTFQSGVTTGWTATGTWSVDQTNPHFGGSSFSAAISGAGTMSQVVTVQPGLSYGFTAAVWSSAADAVVTVKDATSATLFTWTSSGSSFWGAAKTGRAGPDIRATRLHADY